MKVSIKQAIAEELYPSPRNGWKEGLISLEDFLNRIKLESIDFTPHRHYLNYDSVGLEEFIGDRMICVNVRRKFDYQTC